MDKAPDISSWIRPLRVVSILEMCLIGCSETNECKAVLYENSKCYLYNTSDGCAILMSGQQAVSVVSRKSIYGTIFLKYVKVRCALLWVCVRARVCVCVCVFLAVYNKAQAQRISNHEFKLSTFLQGTESRVATFLAETCAMCHQYVCVCVRVCERARVCVYVCVDMHAFIHAYVDIYVPAPGRLCRCGWVKEKIRCEIVMQHKPNSGFLVWAVQKLFWFRKCTPDTHRSAE